MRYMHDLDKYLPPTSMKGKSAEADNWIVRNLELTLSEIMIEIMERLSSYIQDELEDHKYDYRSLNHEEWCDLLSTIKVKE